MQNSLICWVNETPSCSHRYVQGAGMCDSLVRGKGIQEASRAMTCVLCPRSTPSSDAPPVSLNDCASTCLALCFGWSDESRLMKGRCEVIWHSTVRHSAFPSPSQPGVSLHIYVACCRWPSLALRLQGLTLA